MNRTEHTRQDFPGRISIYVHIPYCRSKCIYCDFYSEGSKRAEWPRYVTALIREFEWKLKHYSCRDCDYTLYIGGGTPSLMPEKDFAILSRGIIDRMKRPPLEFTIEVNPDDVTARIAESWKRDGVNRVSMGVQSLVDKELKAIGRRHDASAARKAYAELRKVFNNISLDLIFGLPYQTVDTLATTIDGFLEMVPEHISAYSLMYEERTALTRLRDLGKIEETGDDITVAMFGMLTQRLKDSGYDHYEISNYAKEGYQSWHNSSYWLGYPYIGLGAGAHSYDGHNTRSWYDKGAAEYMRLWNGSEKMEESPDRHYGIETLTTEELREEMIMTRMRMARGLDIEEYSRQFGKDATAQLMAAAREYISRGLVRMQNGRLCLTNSGILTSDEIISSLF